MFPEEIVCKAGRQMKMAQNHVHSSSVKSFGLITKQFLTYVYKYVHVCILLQ
jgi:hypothetical protein